MAQTYKCTICDEPLNLLGAYVKRSWDGYAHLPCHDKGVAEEAIENFKRVQNAEEERSKQEAESRRDADLRGVFARLSRCTKCGVKATNEPEIVQQCATLGEVRVFSSAVPGRCMVCVREEAQARQAAKGNTPTCVRCKKPAGGQEHPNTCDACWNSDAPTKSVAAAVKPIEKLDETLKRFSLLELD